MKRKILIFTALFVVFIYTSVFSETMKVSYDTDTCAVKVSGILGENFGNKRVLLYCVSENDSRVLPEDTGTQYSTDYYKIFRQTKTDVDGKYSFEGMKINSADGGKYDFILTLEDNGGTFRLNSQYIPSLNEINAFVREASDSGSIYAALEKEVATGEIGADLTLYKMLTPEGRKKAADAVSNTSFSKVSEVSSAVNSSSAGFLPLYVNNAENMDKVLFPDDYPEMDEYKSLIIAGNGYNSFAIANADIDETLKAMSVTDRIEVYGKIKLTDSDSVTDFYDKLQIACISFEINKVSGYGDISLILEKYSGSALSVLDYASYSACKYKNDINEDILKKSFNSVKELCDYVNNEIEEYNKKTAAKNSGGGGGEGGGSSSFGVVPVVSPVNVSDTVFTDISGFEWAKNAILTLYEKKIVSGVGNGLFEPERIVKREEFIKMLILSIGRDIKTGDSSLSDVDNGAWYAPYIYTALIENIAKGITVDEFGIGMPITRQDAAVLIWRVENEPAAEYGGTFSDESDIGEYAIDAVRWMKKEELISGYEDSTFRPQKPITRAEAAQILNSFIAKRNSF